MVLRNPKYGNTFSVDTGVTTHSLLDSDVQVFKPSNRPTTKGFSVTLEALDDSTKDRLIQFFIESAAEIVTVIDHEGTSWIGMIMDESIVIKESGRTCKWETSFRFEAE